MEIISIKNFWEILNSFSFIISTNCKEIQKDNFISLWLQSMEKIRLGFRPSFMDYKAFLLGICDKISCQPICKVTINSHYPFPVNYTLTSGIHTICTLNFPHTNQIIDSQANKWWWFQTIISYINRFATIQKLITLKWIH